MIRGSRRSIEGQVLSELVFGQINWKPSFDDPESGSIEVVVTMGDFIRGNFDFVYMLNKSLDEKKTKNVKIESEKEIQ